LEFGKWKIVVILRAINHWENEKSVSRKVDELRMRFVGGKFVDCCALEEVGCLGMIRMMVGFRGSWKLMARFWTMQEV
jgi:hypothetical protein